MRWRTAWCPSQKALTVVVRSGSPPRGAKLVVHGKAVIRYGRGLETGARHEAQHSVRLVDQQNVGGIYTKSSYGLVQDHLESQAQIRAARYRKPHAAQRRQAFESVDGIHIELRILDGQAGPIRYLLNPTNVSLGQRLRSSRLKQSESAHDSASCTHRGHEDAEMAG